MTNLLLTAIIAALAAVATPTECPIINIGTPASLTIDNVHRKGITPAAYTLGDAIEYQRDAANGLPPT